MRGHGRADADNRPQATSTARLVIRNLRKEYRAGTPVLKDISLTVEGRGMTAIIGPSGTGKSTLIRCINRLVDPTSGEILFRGQDMRRLAWPRVARGRRHIGMVFQEYNLVERLSVIENVLCGRLGYVPAWRAWLRGFPRDIERAFHLLDAVGLGDFATQRADQLSGGQRQRVGIARALMQEPRPHARRRAHLLARSEDLGRDHELIAGEPASAAFR